MSLDLNAVMDAIGTRLVGVAGLRTADYAAQSINVPQAIVSLPTSPIEYDATMARGADRAVIPVLVLVAAVSDRASRDQVAAYLSGTGVKSIKAAIEGTTSDLGGAAQTVRVMTGQADVITVGAVDYAAASFEVEVFA